MRPADLYLEGSDQHRGWFHSSLLTSSMLNGTPPYKALLTHGFTVDAEGKKMSKSLGNTLAPQKISDTLGADILRLWVASTDYTGELSISEEILKRVTESYRRIRNTLRFLLANTSDFDHAVHAVPVTEMLEIDQYAVAAMAQLQASTSSTTLSVSMSTIRSSRFTASPGCLCQVATVPSSRTKATPFCPTKFWAPSLKAALLPLRPLPLHRLPRLLLLLPMAKTILLPHLLRARSLKKTVST